MRPSVSYEEYRKKIFEDEEFKKVWDEMQPELEIMRAIADGRRAISRKMAKSLSEVLKVPADRFL